MFKKLKDWFLSVLPQFNKEPEVWDFPAPIEEAPKKKRGRPKKASTATTKKVK